MDSIVDLGTSLDRLERIRGAKIRARRPRSTGVSPEGG
jgi:hypothetical protein